MIEKQPSKPPSHFQYTGAEEKSGFESEAVAARAYEAIFRNASELICVLESGNGRIIRVNPAFEAVLGYTGADIAGSSFFDFVHPEDTEDTKRAAGFEQHTESSGENTARFGNRYRCKDGSFRHLEWCITVLPDDGVAYCIAHDVTGHSRAEQAAAEGERQYLMLYRSAPIGIFTTSSTGQLISANRTMATVLGCGSPEQALERFTDLGRQFYASSSRREEFLRILRERGSISGFEVQGKTADGRTIWIDLSARVSSRENDGSFLIEGFATDITERKLNQIERDRLMHAIEHAGESIIITDSEWKIVYVNPSFEQTTGYTREDARAHPEAVLKSDAHDDSFYEETGRILREGTTWYGHVVSRRKDGSSFTEDATISPVFDDTGNIVNFVLVKRDITDELAMEGQYRQAQKMESIGRLSGGVAHDFNNILTIIQGYMELLAQTGDLSPTGEDAVAEVKRAIGRASSLTQQLLAFGRKQVVEPRILDVARVVEEMRDMLERLIEENIDFSIEMAENLGCIRADPDQMQQIMINLAVNARDAMPEGGRITITGDVLDTSRETIPGLEDISESGKLVRLTVSDTGEGIDPTYLDKIFEPFFTLKSVGKGTGLGLSTVYGIVRQSGGHVDVESVVGRGTAFHIYFPRVSESESDGVAGRRAPAKPGHVMGTRDTAAGEVILVAEDESILREMIARTLRNEGYTVIEAKDGTEAIELGRSDTADAIDLLLTDVIMPKVRGMDVARQLRRNYPEMKVLYVSGYTAPEFRSLDISDEYSAYLQKPFSSTRLLRTIAELLDG